MTVEQAKVEREALLFRLSMLEIRLQQPISKQEKHFLGLHDNTFFAIQKRITHLDVIIGSNGEKT